MAICAAPSSDGMVNGVVNTVDCHIRVLVQDSYRDLVGPGTPFAAAFTAMLTIYIALVGYQLLLGRGGVRLASLPMMALKIGLIMAFVTSWAAYQTVFFSFLFDGPREIVGGLLHTTVGGANVYDGVEHAYAALSDAAQTYGSQASPAGNILQGGPMLGSGLLWLAAIGLLLTTVGVILAAKIVLGFLLAIGPVFVGLFLFDATRGLFDGWLRATLAFALTPLAANVFGAAMLMMLAPFVGVLSENVTAGTFDMAPIVTISLIVVVFAIVMAMALKAASAIGGGFTTPAAQRWAPGALVASANAVEAAAPMSGARAVEAATRIELDRSDARRADPVREAAADVGFERLGQAYRRMPRPRTQVAA